MTTYPNKQVFQWVLNTGMQFHKLFCGFTLHLAASRINLALSGKAVQSSLLSYQSFPHHAIDGNTEPLFSRESCSSTHYETKGWWRLELPGVYRVSELHVTNRLNQRQRLNGVQVLIGNSLVNNGNDNPR